MFAGSMLFTIILALMQMAGLFVMLLGGVGFIQDKRFFSSAPKQVLDVVPERKQERFVGQRCLGWILIVLAVVLLIGPIIIGAFDGLNNQFGFWQFFTRFTIMLLGLKAFDIGFFDWFLLCNAGLNFFPHFYPETKEFLEHYLFGYNWKTHFLHILTGVPLMALLAMVCTFLE